MKVEWDDDKAERNLEKHGVGFDLAVLFDFRSAARRIDDRFDYGETRWIALGFIRDRLHAIVYAEKPEGIRVISLRKANERERRDYERQRPSTGPSA